MTTAQSAAAVTQRRPDGSGLLGHERDPPRRYASFVCSGVLGLGSTREQDVQALTQLKDALLPGGTLVLDNEEKPFRWHARDWNEPSDGEISLCRRVDAVDEEDRCVYMTIRVETAAGRREEHALTMRQWDRDSRRPKHRPHATYREKLRLRCDLDPVAHRMLRIGEHLIILSPRPSC